MATAPDIFNPWKSYREVEKPKDEVSFHTLLYSFQKLNQIMILKKKCISEKCSCWYLRVIYDEFLKIHNIKYILIFNFIFKIKFRLLYS